MTAITFPNSPSTGDTHTAGNGLTYTYDGEKWTSVGAASANAWTRSGTTVSLTTAGDDLNVDSGTLFVDASTDNVGIGTTSPLTSSGFTGITTSGSTGGIYWFAKAGAQKGYLYGQDNDVTLASTDSSGIIRLLTGGNNERMRIDSSGRLLVGTTSFLSGLTGLAQVMTSGSQGGLVINSTDTSSTSYGRLMFTPNGNITGNEGLIRYNNNDYHMAFYTAGGERMRIDSAGKMILPTGSPGIQFGSSNTGTNITNQTLDDYEEGTWTPTLTSGTCTPASCRYVKIGNVVHCSGQLGSFSDTSSSNVVQVSLPFNCNAGHAMGSAMMAAVSKETMVTYTTQNKMSFYGISSSTTWVYLTHADLNSGHYIYFQATFRI